MDAGVLVTLSSFFLEEQQTGWSINCVVCIAVCNTVSHADSTDCNLTVQCVVRTVALVIASLELIVNQQNIQGYRLNQRSGCY